MKKIAYSNRLYLEQKESMLIKNDIQIYRRMLIHSYHIIYHMNMHHLKVNSLQKKVKSFYGTNDYFPLSAIHEAKALYKASLGSHNLNLKKIKKRMSRIEIKLGTIEKEIKQISKHLEKLVVKTQEGKQTKQDYLLEVQVLKPKLKALKSRKGLVQFRYNRIQDYHKCLISRVKMIRFKEATSMTIPGRRQGKYSNCVFKYHIDEGILVYRGTKQDIYLPIQFHYQEELLKQKIQLPHNTPGKAVAYQLVDKGKYFLIKAILECDDCICHTTKKQGCIGVDINKDHLALTEVNEAGNLVFTTTYPIEGVNAKQRKHCLQGLIKQIVEDCAVKQKDCILEDLDFEYKKSESLYQGRRRNRNLSEFAYNQILEMFTRKRKTYGVRVEVVNPAYTSVMSKIKVTRIRGLSIHQGAAMIIARRGMGFEERIPKEIQHFAKTWKEVKKTFKQAKHNEHPNRALLN